MTEPPGGAIAVSAGTSRKTRAALTADPVIVLAEISGVFSPCLYLG